MPLWVAEMSCAPETATRPFPRLPMTEIRSEIGIHASAEHVWEVLTDFSSYDLWNSVLHPIRGEAKAGGRLKVRVRLLGGLGVSFRVTVLRAELGRELRWKGEFLHSSLFVGEHSFAIEPMGNGSVRFVQHEVYTGRLVPLIMLILGSSNRRIFEEMNKALKARVEKAQKLL